MRFSLRQLLLFVFIAAILVATEMYLMLWSAAQAAYSLLSWIIAYIVFVALYSLAMWRLVPFLLYCECAWLLRWPLGRKTAARWLNEHGARLYERENFAAAAVALTAAIDADSTEAAYWENRGASRSAAGDIQGAEQDLSEAIARDGSAQRSFLRRGEMRLALGDYQGCLNDLQTIDPNQEGSAASFAMRGIAHEALQHWAEAIDDYASAYRRDQYAGILLGRLYSGCPEPDLRSGAQAIEVATKVCLASEWKDWRAISVLASGYAEAGDFQRALEYAEQALSLASEEERPERQRRIEQYKASLPFRISDSEGDRVQPICTADAKDD
jgi:tetratricopeptide (TPR) repeat protein